VIAWLLERGNPCVRWRTLRELLGRAEDDPDVLEAAAAVYAWPPIRRVLQMLEDPDGFVWPPGIRAGQWARAGRDLAMLTRVGVPPGLPELRSAARRLVAERPDNRSSDCYQPQHVAALLRYGDPDDPDVVPLVHRVIANELMADGNRPPTGGGGACCISHSCHNAVARALDCVAAVPEQLRTDEVRAFIARGISYLGAHRLYQKNHHGFRPIRGEYTRLRQPWGLDWLTDVLDLLDIATRLGMAESPALVPALQWLLSRRDPDGRWPLETVYATDRPLIANLLRDVEHPGGPGKWVALTALIILRRCAGLVARIDAGETFVAPEPRPFAGFTPYPWPDDPADEARTREEWSGLAGMVAVLDALTAFAREHGLRTGWYRGFAMGPDECREWCCATAKLVPARSIRVAFPVVRVRFLAPAGQFTASGLCERLGVGPVHPYAGTLRSGSWVEKALWRVRVERWTRCWDTVGIAVTGEAELARAKGPLAEALRSSREVLVTTRAGDKQNHRKEHR
jgi:hypothetical protein